MQHRRPMDHPFPKKLVFLGLTSALLAGLQAPSQAASRVAFRYGPFQRSVPVAALREYAETGEASPELRSILRRVPAGNRDAVRQLLQVTLPVNVVTVDRFLRTPQGQGIVSQIANITIRKDQAGEQAARGALIVGTARPGGLGVLSFLESYPSSTVVLNLPRALAFAQESQELLRGVGGRPNSGSGQPLPGTGQPGQPPQ
jgi:hypothetical protein